MDKSFVECLFWFALIVIFYTYFGYGLIVILVVKIKSLFKWKKLGESPSYTPEVTLLIAAYNEEEVIHEKMQNTLSLYYPKEQLNIVWVTDGSDDKTNELLSNFNNIKVLFKKERRGKTAAINRAMNLIDSPIVVFTDANTMLNQNAVFEIVRPFMNSKVGCVAGEKRIYSSTSSNVASQGEGIYWKYESYLKQLDSCLYSTVGAAGELFAIRRDLFDNLETEILLDDFVLSMRVAMKGYRIAYCKEAYAIEAGSVNIKEEGKRKIRIAAGGLQSIKFLWPLLNILKYHIFSVQYVSRKLFRWTIVPVLFFSLFPLNAIIVIRTGNELFVLILVLQSLFYLLAVWGYFQTRVKNSFLIIPYYLLFMQLSVFLGLNYLIKRKKGIGFWEKSKRLQNDSTLQS